MIKRGKMQPDFINFLQSSGALCSVAFSLVPYTSSLSSDEHGRAKAPLASIWKEWSAPQARHEKKPIQYRPVHKSLAHVDRGRRLLGAEQQCSRQTGRQAACPPRLSLMISPVLLRRMAHRNKSC